MQQLSSCNSTAPRKVLAHSNSISSIMGVPKSKFDNIERTRLLMNVKQLEMEVERMTERNKLLEQELIWKDTQIERLKQARGNRNRCSCCRSHLEVTPGEEGARSTPVEETSDDESKNDNVLKPQGKIEEMQRFLFLEARHISDPITMLDAYIKKLLVLGIPLDRFFVGGFVEHPKAVAYNWKWTKTDGWIERRVPKTVLDTLKETNEPFCLMYHGKAKRIRILPGEGVPYDSQWYEDEDYQDYLALEITYRNKFMGGVAWATKQLGGFTSDHLKVLEELQPDFATVIAHHIHDTGYLYLSSVLDEEVEERTKELAVANKRLEEANRRVVRHSQNQLRHFAMMSHEIRTPLNCIVGMSSLVEASPKLHKDLEDSVRMIVESGDLLCAVVNDVLDYSRLESGHVDIELNKIDLLSTLSTVVDSIRCKGNEKSVVVKTQFESALPHQVTTDGRRLQQILYNLMGNALKFSHESSSIELSVSTVQNCSWITNNASLLDKGDVSPSPLSSQPQDHTTIRFTVKDYGRGIKKEDLNKIFEPFTQASTDTQRLYGGTGLGLAITSKLVKGLGGRIQADSEFGSWSEFVVEIPVSIYRSDGESTTEMESESSVTETPEGEEEEEETLDCAIFRSGNSSSSNPLTDSSSVTRRQSAYEKQPSADFSGLRILIAEDNIVNQKVLERNLEAIGLVYITIVDNGQKAVDEASKSYFDVIFMDVQMPVLDGLEACQQILKLEVPHEQPKIVFCTAHALAHFQAEAEAAGGSGFISKPFNRKKLEEILFQIQ